MTPLQQLVARYLRDNTISRSEFAKQLGYSNTNKGLKRLDHYLLTLHSSNNDMASLILKNTRMLRCLKSNGTKSNDSVQIKLFSYSMVLISLLK